VAVAGDGSVWVALEAGSLARLTSQRIAVPAPAPDLRVQSG
jgi:hypothetical protein